MKAKVKDGKQSERGSSERSRQVTLSATESRMRVMAPSPPPAVIIWVRSVWTLFTFLSLQTSFERVVDYGFHQRFTAMRRDQVCPSSNKLTSHCLFNIYVNIDFAWLSHATDDRAFLWCLCGKMYVVAVHATKATCLDAFPVSFVCSMYCSNTISGSDLF